MNNIFKISGIILIILINNTCKKEKPTPPVLTTKDVTEVSYTTATSGGEVTNEGGSPVTAKGICWNTSIEPTIDNNLLSSGGGLGSFTCNITQLTSNTLYYVRAYATNIIGTSYGDQVSFTTSQITPAILTTNPVSSIGSTTAVSGGNITNSNGGAVTQRGVCWAMNSNPTTSDNKSNDGIGIGTFNSNMFGLLPGTIYYVRAYSINIAGISYGDEISFTTNPPSSPIVSTTSVSSITFNSATCGGNVTGDGGAIVIDRGVCWSITQNPTILDSKTTDGTGTGLFSSFLTNLIPENTYYLRAFATNNIGTSYGNEIIFVTNKLSATDVDGNFYNTVKIGTQVWLTENLKTTKFNDGTPIPNVTDNIAWISLITPGYCWYNNDAATNKAAYGALYNWYVVNKQSNGTRNVCPTGWHVPSDAEWITLQNFLGGESIAGGKLKETGTTHWASPNTGATNESGFTSVPAGDRTTNGVFSSIRFGSYCWSTAESGISSGRAWMEFSNSEGFSSFSGISKDNGLSIRCLRDN